MKNVFLSKVVSFLFGMLCSVCLIAWFQEEPEPEIREIKVPIYNTVLAHESFEVPYSPHERDLLASVVHAEAGNQDQIGKRLVVDVILNRIDDDDFPDTVADVINQDGQFTYNNTYTADDLKAVDAELNERLDYDVLWFRTKKYHIYGKPAYQHGDHFFNKEE